MKRQELSNTRNVSGLRGRALHFVGFKFSLPTVSYEQVIPQV